MIIDHRQVTQLALELHAVPDGVEAKVRLAVGKTENDTVAQAQVAAPVDSGDLENSIGSEPIAGGMGFKAGPTVEYGLYVEEGTTGPYEIENAFGWGITVTHPGIAPQPYMGPAFDRNVTQLERATGAIGYQALAG